MPPNNGVGLDHTQFPAPVEEPAQSGYHESYGVGSSVRLCFALFEERELFAEEEILGGQRGARPKAECQEAA